MVGLAILITVWPDMVLFLPNAIELRG
jgi:hypothetical protein